jgi:predicted metalloendopeptidase
MKRTLCSVVVLLSCAAGAADLKSGIDLAHVDPSVRAQDDFFRYSQGKWLKDVEIPADRSSWGAFNVAQDNVENRIRTLIEDAEKDPARKPGSDMQKIGDFYASYLDETARAKLGLAPLQAELDRARKLDGATALAAEFAHLQRIGAGAPIGIEIHQDNKDSTHYIADLKQSGLGLPNRDYYLADQDARLAGIRAEYQRHIARMLALAGHRDATAEAAQLVALETALARIQWSAVANRDPVKVYNKRTLAELKAMMPGFDWAAYLGAAGIAGKADAVVVSQPSYVEQLDKLAAATPLPVWRSYAEFRLLSAYAPYLAPAFVDESFAFRGKVLSGATVNRPLPRRAVAEVNRSLGELVGKAYVARYFPAERKRQVEDMVHNFLLAYKESIETLDWMSAETKKQAQAKLAKINVKVGYPAVWRDYTALDIRRGDLVGNVLRARAFAHERDVDKLGKPVDRSEWDMTPQTVNAYYNPELNEVVFPAARLQYPLYDPDADMAVNYGAVGISIGHEISHAFDDEGSRYDGDGNLRNWWTKEDEAKFAARGKVLVAQYAGYSPLPGYNLNGELTLGENIADNAGAVMASRAYRIAMHGQPGPVIDGFTAEQRLFLGLAQARRGKARDAALIQQVKADPHSPAEFRVNGSLRNHPGFYEAFHVQPGDRMYLPPEQRVRFW